MPIPPRLHVLLARGSSQALIIRRGPSKQTAVIGWNRATDRFVVGQWLKGKIYGFRSDISPDGRHWVYFAMNAHNETWTALAKTPYLKALDFYPKQDAWNGGGLFESDQRYWLNEAPHFAPNGSRCESGLSVAPDWRGERAASGECPGVYFRRLLRDGWEQGPLTHNETRKTTPFFKNAGNRWRLKKLFHAGSDRDQGKGVYYETHALIDTVDGEEISFPHMEWADLDKGRLVWAECGKIMAGRVSKEGLVKQKELFDTSPFEFKELAAPD